MIKVFKVFPSFMYPSSWIVLGGLWILLSIPVCAEESRYGHDPAADQAIRGSHAIAMDDDIIIATPDDVFATLRRGKPVGIIAETVDQVLVSMGYTEVHYVSMTRKEMRQAVKNGTVDVAVSVLTPTDRFDQVYYTDPIIDEYSVILVRRGSEQTIRFVSDLYGKRIGGRSGYQYPAIENNPEILLELNRKDGENVRKLLLQELDAVIVGGVADLYELRTEGIMNEVEILDRALGTVSLGAAFADEHFRQEEVHEFNRQLAQLKASPSWQQILERNGMSDLVREWPLLENRPLQIPPQPSESQK